MDKESVLRFGRLKQDLNIPFKCRFTVILLSPKVNYLSDVSMPCSRVTINFFFFIYFFNKLGAGRFVWKHLLDFMFGDYRKDKATADENRSCFWIQLAIFCIRFIVLTQSHAAQEKFQISKDYTHKNITGRQSIFCWYRDILTYISVGQYFRWVIYSKQQKVPKRKTRREQTKYKYVRVYL